MISVANYSEVTIYILPQISLPGSDLHYSFFTVYIATTIRQFGMTLNQEVQSDPIAYLEVCFTQ